ncbi:IPT/TIG domain-containing protein [Streptomyces sp. NPDC088789]|uniref:IPT/TIG domain-containing protein n=1 Tax=Streptomyces sp. NPDC088789 TaxID=3365899 RepID=UPI00381AB3DE
MTAPTFVKDTPDQGNPKEKFTIEGLELGTVTNVVFRQGAKDLKVKFTTESPTEMVCHVPAEAKAGDYEVKGTHTSGEVVSKLHFQVIDPPK